MPEERRHHADDNGKAAEQEAKAGPGDHREGYVQLGASSTVKAKRHGERQRAEDKAIGSLAPGGLVGS